MVPTLPSFLSSKHYGKAGIPSNDIFFGRWRQRLLQYPFYEQMAVFLKIVWQLTQRQEFVHNDYYIYIFRNIVFSTTKQQMPIRLYLSLTDAVRRNNHLCHHQQSSVTLLNP